MGRRLAVAFVLLASLVLIGYCLAQPPCAKMKAGQEKPACMQAATQGEPRLTRPCCIANTIAGMIDRRKEIGLNDDQVSKLKSLKTDAEKQAIKDEAEIQTLELGLEELIGQESFDASAIDGQIDKMAAQRAKMAKAQVHALLDARKLLTPEQNKKARELGGPTLMKLDKCRTEGK